MAAHQTEVYTVWCVLSDVLTQFPVEIESNKPVAILKEKIKEKATNILANIDAFRLELYQVEISKFDNMAKDKRREAINKGLSERAELAQRRQLADIFKGGVKEDALIIVKVPKTSE
jgi:Crinkler effector protein N-terminal domain